MADDYEFVPAANCVVCLGDADRRKEHFAAEYIRIPFKGVCIRCFAEYWRAMGHPISEEEIEEFERQQRKH